LGWKKRGLETRLGAKIVSYADDFVICCKGSAEQAMTEMRQLWAAQADGQRNQDARP
jgi:RNA-directed DNA polymerase